MKNIIIYGGNFASKVLIKALDNFKCSIKHFESSNKTASLTVLDKASYIFIAIPPFKNLDFFKKLPTKNKKIFIEKPLSSNLKSAYEIKKICESSNLEIFIDYTLNFIKIFQFLFNEIKINNEKINGYKFIWFTKTLQKSFKNGWKSDSSKGGGGLYNFISHFISLIVNNFSKIISIRSKLEHKYFENFVFHEYSGVIEFKHEKNLNGFVEYNILSDDDEFSLSINTDKNTYKLISVEKDFFKHLKLFKNNEEIYNQFNKKDCDSRIDFVSRSINYFFNSNSSDKMNIEHAIKVQQILHLIQISNIKKEKIFTSEFKM